MLIAVFLFKWIANVVCMGIYLSRYSGELL